MLGGGLAQTSESLTAEGNEGQVCVMGAPPSEGHAGGGLEAGAQSGGLQD